MLARWPLFLGVAGLLVVFGSACDGLRTSELSLDGRAVPSPGGETAWVLSADGLRRSKVTGQLDCAPRGVDATAVYARGESAWAVLVGGGVRYFNATCASTELPQFSDVVGAWAVGDDELLVFGTLNNGLRRLFVLSRRTGQYQSLAPFLPDGLDMPDPEPKVVEPASNGLWLSAGPSLFRYQSSGPPLLPELARLSSAITAIAEAQGALWLSSDGQTRRCAMTRELVLGACTSVPHGFRSMAPSQDGRSAWAVDASGTLHLVSSDAAGTLAVSQSSLQGVSSVGTSRGRFFVFGAAKVWECVSCSTATLAADATLEELSAGTFTDVVATAGAELWLVGADSRVRRQGWPVEVQVVALHVTSFLVFGLLVLAIDHTWKPRGVQVSAALAAAQAVTVGVSWAVSLWEPSSGLASLWGFGTAGQIGFIVALPHLGSWRRAALGLLTGDQVIALIESSAWLRRRLWHGYVRQRLIELGKATDSAVVHAADRDGKGPLVRQASSASLLIEERHVLENYQRKGVLPIRVSLIEKRSATTLLRALSERLGEESLGEDVDKKLVEHGMIELVVRGPVDSPDVMALLNEQLVVGHVARLHVAVDLREPTKPTDTR